MSTRIGILVLLFSGVASTVACSSEVDVSPRLDGTGVDERAEAIGVDADTCSPGERRVCRSKGEGGAQTCSDSGKWGHCAVGGPDAGADSGADEMPTCSGSPTCVYQIAIDKHGDELGAIKIDGAVPACASCCKSNCSASCSGRCGNSGKDDEQGQCYKDAFLSGGSGTSAFVDESCKVVSTRRAPACTKVCGAVHVRLE